MKKKEEEEEEEIGNERGEKRSEWPDVITLDKDLFIYHIHVSYCDKLSSSEYL